jgi:tRNA-splicing ligase RtcB
VVELKTPVPVKTWTHVHEIESVALDQLKNVAALPIVVHHVAVMPDVHFGKGATVGSVIATKGGVSPAAVGVDIGCGMQACRTSLKASDLPDSLKDIRHQIERDIPTGFNSHKDLQHLKRLSLELNNDFVLLFAEFQNLDKHVHNLLGKAQQQVGSLGGGNHFIELCLDEHQNVWLMLHSGSRNIGKELAEIHISKAKELTHNQRLPDRDLAYFLSDTDELKAYRRDLFWAQRYAKLNRKIMFALYKNAITRFFPEVQFEESIDCHHNYVAEEVHFGDHVFVTRKGAIFAGEGALGICPGSMGTRSYIVRGKGNPDSFNSAAHGAGRRMSRGKAKKSFTLTDLENQTSGVECRKDSGVLDEIPGAYKEIDVVMANQSNLVGVEATLKQVLCVKG